MYENIFKGKLGAISIEKIFFLLLKQYDSIINP